MGQEDSSHLEISGDTEAAVNRISSLLGVDTDNPYVKTITRFLNLQHEDGSWGSNDYPILKAVFTAQAIVAMDKLGLVSHPWYSNSDRTARAQTWLRGGQSPNGMWGEDAYDTAQAICALVNDVDPRSKSCINLGLSFLRKCVDEDWSGQPSYWSGPGFIGMSLRAFNVVGDDRYASRALEQLVSRFDPTEERFESASDHTNRAPPEWHTACALVGLASFGPLHPYKDIVDTSSSWLKRSQASKGCWSPGHDEITACCTYQAVVALTDVEGPHCPSAQRGTNWLVEEAQGTSTSPAGYNARFMAAATVAQTHPSQLQVYVDLVFLDTLQTILLGNAHYAEEMIDHMRQKDAHLSNLDTRKEELERQLSDQQQEHEAALRDVASLQGDVASLRAKVEDQHSKELSLREEIGKYALKLTADQLAVLGVVVTIATFFAGLAVAVAL